jgi:ppGpp synthetase/RelA/SpoT-type nucleotidyltranferase
MPLPITKGEFNRLGDRLIAGERPSEADLQDLATALTAYQEVLERVEGHLRDLGFAPSGRVKTTTTMTDKLRRTPGMELSRMQDVAGSRIVVRNLVVQDEARDKISDFYTAQGCRWREVDRRKDPRFGYKAVHLVVRVDDLPVEIQIRTELQDTWAQIVERLADRWGRGIRYGEDPENPDAVVRSGADVYSRHGILTTLMSLSDSIAGVEELRQRQNVNQLALEEFDLTSLQDVYSKADPQRLQIKVPPPVRLARATVAGVLARHSDELDAEGRELLAAGADITLAQAGRMIEIAYSFMSSEIADRAAKLAGLEQRLRDTLQTIAGATDEGE